MTVVCSVCKKEVKDYYFVAVSNDLVPVCSDCSGVSKVAKFLVDVHEARLGEEVKELSFLDKKQTTLGGWTK